MEINKIGIVDKIIIAFQITEIEVTSKKEFGTIIQKKLTINFLLVPLIAIYFLVVLLWPSPVLGKLNYPDQYKNPYSNLLSKDTIDNWTIGKLKLAEYQIHGYLGDLKKNEKWVEKILTNNIAFPNDYKTQFNRGKSIKPTLIDIQNLQLLKDRIEELSLSSKQETPFLEISNIYDRLIERSKTELLVDYKVKELDKLNSKSMYLLRNEIYARRGLPFITPKLHKYFKRKSWYKPVMTEKEFDYYTLSPVELCNVNYLEYLNNIEEMGACGRGVTVTINSDKFDNLSGLIKSSLVEKGIEIYNSDIDKTKLFSDYVDVIIEIETGKSNQLYVNSITDNLALNKETKQLDFELEALANHINSDLNKIPISFEIKKEHSNFVGLKFVLSEDAISKLNSPSNLTRFSKIITKRLYNLLDSKGSLFPDYRNIIIERPIVFDKVRNELTMLYLKKHYDITQNNSAITPQMIVLHWTAINDLDSSFSKLNNVKITSDRKDISSQSELNVSAHYLVDRNGSIFHLLADTIMARHTIGLNYCSIGIENVGGDKGLLLSDEQIAANVKLIYYLTSRHKDIKWLIGHKEYGQFRNSQLWKEVDKNYFTEKNDPNDEFLKEVRDKTISLGLKDKP